jgi:hypothetical protein
MAQFRLRAFSNVDILQEINPSRLIEFLNQFPSFFRSRNLNIKSDSSLDYEQLVQVLMSPNSDTPDELVDALYFVDQMATELDCEAFLAALTERDLAYPNDGSSSPADVALWIWLQDPDLLRSLHAEQFLSKSRSFESYLNTQREDCEFSGLSPSQINTVEGDLAQWFAQRNRPQIVRLRCFEIDDKVWFLVRRGDPFCREASLKDNQPCSVGYFPLKHDVLIMDRTFGELRINAKTKNLQDLYRQQFGLHLCGRADFFQAKARYTLEPLRQLGPEGLHCAGIKKLEQIILKELHMRWGGAEGEIEIRKARDVLRAYANRRQEIPRYPKLIVAKFEVKFAKVRRPRSLTIRLPNKADYSRNEDAPDLEEWLRKMKFLVDPLEKVKNVPSPILGSP